MVSNCSYIEDGRHVMVVSGLDNVEKLPGDQINIDLALKTRQSIGIYDTTTDSFTEVNIVNRRDFPNLYPGLHLLPGGQIFFSRTGFHIPLPEEPVRDLINSYFTFT